MFARPAACSIGWMTVFIPGMLGPYSSSRFSSGISTSASGWFASSSLIQSV